ncbi:thioesterase family protein [Bacillus suaedaesalsae]|uniref:Thioesterase n=1 Tax=Bacillus suaedaesalsae TaxID=2810349 RepID=A0ABS2DLQ0_9BACI|nr:thioesterase [Bacillus suaedaesalsae]MBM6619420.1 thioesterase [Bacillus suaedaesalsae]
MKEGLLVGTKECMEIIVTPDMFAQFGGQVVHPVYSTVSMVYHMEWVSRLIILPFIEEHEEGMGGAVTVKHVAPSPEGAILTITAEVTKHMGSVVITRTEVKHRNQVVGVGEVKQVIVPKMKINELIKSL